MFRIADEELAWVAKACVFARQCSFFIVEPVLKPLAAQSCRQWEPKNHGAINRFVKFVVLTFYFFARCEEFVEEQNSGTDAPRTGTAG